VKVAADPVEDGSAGWSGIALLLACRVNGWLVDLLREGIHMLMLRIRNGFSMPKLPCHRESDTVTREGKNAT